jgi:O-antigen/teichoic acid export membrane protein
MVGLYFLIKYHRYFKGQIGAISILDVKHLAGTSSLFFVLQICGLIAFQSDNLIVAYYLGPDSVAVYAIAFKLFTIPSIILSLFLNALWPAYAEAKSRGDNRWIYDTFRKSLKISASIAVPISAITLIFGHSIIETWVGKEVVPTWDLMMGLFFWSLLTVLGGNFAALMNGLGVIKFQAIASLLMALVNIFLSIQLVKIIGVSGVIWGSVISLSLVLYLPSAFYLKRYFKECY